MCKYVNVFVFWSYQCCAGVLMYLHHVHSQIDEPQRPSQRLLEEEPVDELYKSIESSYTEPTPQSSVDEIDSAAYSPVESTGVQARTSSTNVNIDSKTPLLTPETLSGGESQSLFKTLFKTL